MIDDMPHPDARVSWRVPSGLAIGALVALVLTACSTGGADPVSPGDAPADVAAASPGAGPTSDAARAGDPPEFHGRRALAVQPARRVFVQPSCTPDADGMRLCWAEQAEPLERLDAPAAVTLTDAEMRLDDLGLDWSVRLTFADGLGLSEAVDAAPAGGDGRVLLLAQGGSLLRAIPARGVADGEITLPGLEKDEAWDLVELAAGR